MSYTVKDMYTFLKISRTTLHNWTDSLGDLLSMGATDSTSGRKYTERDVAMLWTCKILRDSDMSIPEIMTRLQDGFLIDPDVRPGDSESALVTASTNELAILQVKLQEYETKITTLQTELAERDRTIVRIEAERDLLRELVNQFISRGGS